MSLPSSSLGSPPSGLLPSSAAAFDNHAATCTQSNTMAVSVSNQGNRRAQHTRAPAASMLVQSMPSSSAGSSMQRAKHHTSSSASWHTWCTPTHRSVPRAQRAPQHQRCRQHHSNEQHGSIAEPRPGCPCRAVCQPVAPALLSAALRAVVPLLAGHLHCRRRAEEAPSAGATGHLAASWAEVAMHLVLAKVQALQHRASLNHDGASVGAQQCVVAAWQRARHAL
jgi:hypothetical protein